VVTEAVGLLDRARRADLVVTGEAGFDFSSGSGTVPYAVARVATLALQPCIALAGRVFVGSREMRTLGIESAYSVADLVGERAAQEDPVGSLTALAERTARSWSR
jgi:glycerate kinase